MGSPVCLPFPVPGAKGCAGKLPWMNSFLFRSTKDNQHLLCIGSTGNLKPSSDSVPCSRAMWDSGGGNHGIRQEGPEKHFSQGAGESPLEKNGFIGGLFMGLLRGGTLPHLISYRVSLW